MGEVPLYPYAPLCPYGMAYRRVLFHKESRTQVCPHLSDFTQIKPTPPRTPANIPDPLPQPQTPIPQCPFLNPNPPYHSPNPEPPYPS